MMQIPIGAKIGTPGPEPTIHEGIFAGYDRNGIPLVIENSKIHGEVVVSSLQEFCGGGDWWVIENPPQGMENAIVNRAFSLVGKKYSASYNCQHFASEVYTGEPSSWQLREVGAVAAALGFILWAGQKPARKARKKGSDR